jgi:hypothetical protein
LWTEAFTIANDVAYMGSEDPAGPGSSKSTKDGPNKRSTGPIGIFSMLAGKGVERFGFAEVNLELMALIGLQSVFNKLPIPDHRRWSADTPLKSATGRRLWWRNIATGWPAMVASLMIYVIGFGRTVLRSRDELIV